MALPELYRYGREGKWFNLRRFTYYMFQGLLQVSAQGNRSRQERVLIASFPQSAIVYFIICYAYVTTSARTDGYNVGQYEMSTVMVIGAVMVANIFTGLNTDAWTVWVWFGVLFGPVLIWIYTVRTVWLMMYLSSALLTWALAIRPSTLSFHPQRSSRELR